MASTPRGVRQIFLFLLFAIGVIGLRSAWLQVIHAHEYTERPYRDQKLHDAVGKLFAQGGVVPESYLGRIDQEKLPQIIPQRSLQRQLVHLDDMGLFEVVNGNIELTPNAIQMRNPRTMCPETPPGRILDRNQTVLAESDDEGVRRYPYGPATFHVLGKYSRVYRRTGLEALWDQWDEAEILTTLDAELQEEAYKQLGDQRGAIVMLDVQTGGILVMTSTPSFDPNQKPGRAWVLASKDQDTQPFLNRATEQLYPPGSTFKMVVASMALQQPGFDPRTTIMCTGQRYRIKEHEIHHRTDLHRAVSESCNGYFGWLGVEMGAEPIREVAALFGFGRSWHIAPGLESATSTVPSGRIPHLGLLAQIAIGQYDVRATPLQMALVSQAIANRGILMRPRLLLSSPAEAVDQVVPSNVATELRGMMLSVMEEGSGNWVPRIYRQVDADGVRYSLAYRNHTAEWIRVAGKTGTAETGIDDDIPHSWFIGFAPAEAPRYAICVLVENGDWGSVTAAPMASHLFAKAMSKAEANAILLASNL